MFIEWTSSERFKRYNQNLRSHFLQNANYGQQLMYVNFLQLYILVVFRPKKKYTCCVSFWDLFTSMEKYLWCIYFCVFEPSSQILHVHSKFQTEIYKLTISFHTKCSLLNLIWFYIYSKFEHHNHHQSSPILNHIWYI